MDGTNWRLIELPKVRDARGNLTFIEGGSHVPFDIRRVYYLYDIPGGADRAGHAHKELEQVIIAVAGSFDVTLWDGQREARYHLSLPHLGLYLGRMVWRTIDSFSSGAVCLALASLPFDESDYYRDREVFERAVATKGH